MHGDPESQVVIVLGPAMPDVRRLVLGDIQVPICLIASSLGQPGEDVLGGAYQQIISLMARPIPEGFGKDTIDIGDEPGFDPCQGAPRSYRRERPARRKPRWKRRNRRK